MRTSSISMKYRKFTMRNRIPSDRRWSSAVRSITRKSQPIFWTTGWATRIQRIWSAVRGRETATPISTASTLIRSSTQSMSRITGERPWTMRTSVRPFLPLWIRLRKSLCWSRTFRKITWSIPSLQRSSPSTRMEPILQRSAIWRLWEIPLMRRRPWSTVIWQRVSWRPKAWPSRWRCCCRTILPR